MPLSLSTTRQTFLSDIILNAECPQLKRLPPPKKAFPGLFPLSPCALGQSPCVCPGSQHRAQFLLALVAFHSSSWCLSGCSGTLRSTLVCNAISQDQVPPRGFLALPSPLANSVPLSLTQNDLQLSVSFTVLRRTLEELTLGCLGILFFVFVIVISHPCSTNSP